MGIDSFDTTGDGVAAVPTPQPARADGARATASSAALSGTPEPPVDQPAGVRPRSPHPAGRSQAATPLLDQTLTLPAALALRPTQALLLVRRGPAAGSKFILSARDTMIGRSTEATILLDDVTVSREHARILRRAGRFFVRDAGSSNGTYVNGRRSEVALLVHGDELTIGGFALVFLASLR